MTVQTWTPGSEIADLQPSQLTHWVAILEPAALLADRIANTEFVPTAMRGKPDVICAAIMYGDEIGIGPMQALAGIHVVEGRPSPSSELMRALILRAGHQLIVEESSGMVCTVTGVRRGERSRTTITWDLQMARAAGLLNKAVWQRYPRAMLLARATSELARTAFPDVVKGLGHIADDEAIAAGFDSWAAEMGEEPAPTTPATTTVRRRRKPASKAPSDQGTPAADEDPPPPAAGAARLPTTPPDLGRGIHDVPLPGMPPLPADAAGTPEPLPPVDDADTALDKPITDGALRGVHAGFGRIGIPSEGRDQRLAIASASARRQVESTKDLTRHEALTLVRHLADIETGALILQWREDGTALLLAGGS